MNQYSTKIVITGSSGSVGSIVKSGLSEKYDLTLIDKVNSDEKNFYQIDLAKDQLKLDDALKDKDMVIHLAWDNYEDFPNENIWPENKTMAENLLRSCVKNNVKKVIIASSVHADDYSKGSHDLITVDKQPSPDTPYGASKLYIESLANYFANKHKIKVACLRLGGVNPDDEIRFEEDPNYDKVMLYKRDLIGLIECIINSWASTDFFTAFYVVSENGNRIHSTDNIFGWQPERT